MEQVKADPLNLFNICGGGVPERFQTALYDVLENISDVNMSAANKRTIVMTFEFTPYPDRSAFGIKVQCKPGLAPVEAIEGIAYVMKQDGHVRAFARDVRQQSLFEPEEAAPDGKSAGAGDGKVVGIAR